MRQLVELRDNAKDALKKHNAEVIAVFREEKQGTEGLAAIKKKTGVDFTLALDLGKKATPAYSPGQRAFDNYVIGKSGKVLAVIDGTLRTRAKAEQIGKILDATK